MTPDEFITIMAMLEINYNQHPGEQKIDFYFAYLGNYDYVIMKKAVDELILTNKYPNFPTIGAIKEAYNSVLYKDELSAAESYSVVIKAVKNYGSHGGEKACAGFDYLTKKTVESIGWETICLSTLPSAIRSDYLKCYEQFKKRKHDDDLRSDIAKKLCETAVKRLT